MNTKKLLELVKVVESHQIEEIEISRFGMRIRISKSGIQRESGKNGRAHMHEYIPQPPVTALPAPTAVPEPSDEDEIQLSENQIEVKSPIVGTFYRAPAPDAEPYTRVGDIVSLGQPLCIIEAMKIMNVIEAEHAGKLVRIIAENAHPVEYNQTLFVIEKS